jgi:hypothetical protein
LFSISIKVSPETLNSSSAISVFQNLVDGILVSMGTGELRIIHFSGLVDVYRWANHMGGIDSTATVNVFYISWLNGTIPLAFGFAEIYDPDDGTLSGGDVVLV